MKLSIADALVPFMLIHGVKFPEKSTGPIWEIHVFVAKLDTIGQVFVGMPSSLITTYQMS